MPNINHTIEVEYTATVERLNEELEELTLIYYALKGDSIAKFIKGGFLMLLQLLFFLLTISGVLFFISLEFLEPAILIELLEELHKYPGTTSENLADISVTILLFKILSVGFSLLLGIIAFLIGRIRRKNSEIRDSISILEALMNNTRGNLDKANEKLKHFREFAAEQRGRES